MQAGRRRALDPRSANAPIVFRLTTAAWRMRHKRRSGAAIATTVHAMAPDLQLVASHFVGERGVTGNPW